ncbi:MAG: hypothetical protein IKW90_15735 [Lachnospiraceae bacterium]|nr:hypothetical protein [Lachnospiraceae bacterium]
MKINIDKLLKIIVMILLTIVAFKLALSKQIIYAIIIWSCIALVIIKDIIMRYKE